MKNKFGIEEIIFAELINTFKNCDNLIQVKLFGSRARGDFKETSDIDLAVKFSKEDEKLKLIEELENIRCILKFDVINIDTISNNLLIQNINKDGIIIYKK